MVIITNVIFLKIWSNQEESYWWQRANTRKYSITNSQKPPVTGLNRQKKPVIDSLLTATGPSQLDLLKNVTDDLDKAVDKPSPKHKKRPFFGHTYGGLAVVTLSAVKPSISATK